MTDTLNNTPLPANTWVDLYATTGITIGIQIVVENVGLGDVKLVEQAAEPTNATGFSILRRKGLPQQNDTSALGAWAYSQGVDGVVNVRAA